jgi:dTDP-4-amino-4,6-dideoxygalactose transaminase
VRRVPLSKPFINGEIRQAVLDVLDSGRFILGPQCQEFERDLARFAGRKHAVLSSSWTAGVYLLHLAMALRAGDEVIVPSHTAFPSIEPMLHCGARPAFVDIDDTYCMDPELVEAAITPRTVGILPVHLYGHPADLDRITEIARRHDLWVIEDCAQAHGALYKGRPVGSIGMAGAFSFYPSKNLTVLGDGGCVVTDDDAIADRIRMLRDHGRRGKYTHEVAGFNLRFNEIQAAAGRVGLRHLEQLNARRRAAAARYRERLAGIVGLPGEHEWATPVYHMFVIRTPRRDELAGFLKERGIETGIHYPVPNHLQPAITSIMRNLPALPRTEQAVGEILSLPIHGEIAFDDVDYVCDCIIEYAASEQNLIS